jgi:hypothetical protein
MSLPVGTLAQTECDPVDLSLKGKREFLKKGWPWPNEPPPDCIETQASYVLFTRDRLNWPSLPRHRTKSGRIANVKLSVSQTANR